MQANVSASAQSVQRRNARILLAAAAFASIFIGSGQSIASNPSAQPELLLEGTVDAAQNHSYIKVPFQVPAGARRVTIAFDYTGREEHTALDLGLLDTSGLRCWSGGNKSVLTVGLSDATPSCLPGDIPAGAWNVLIGVPNIREHAVSHYTVHVSFAANGAVSSEPASLRLPLRTGPAWYRGDLHTHTAHSDGQCRSQSGKMAPCPVFVTAEAAMRRGLDFVAITDHNASSQYDDLRELQPYFDTLLLIPGREITTFQGHVNALGATDFIDFRLDGKTVRDMNTLLRAIHDAGAIASINHPMLPSGEICMGCGWTPSVPADMRLVTGVEAVNGGSEQYGLFELPFWDAELNRGCRLTGLGGSDNHRPQQAPTEIGSVGSPTTVVYADELSTVAILDGIRAGHVFIDVEGTQNRMLEVSLDSGGKLARSGDELDLQNGVTARLQAKVSASAGGKLRWIEDGHEIAAAFILASDKETAELQWKSHGQRHWLRVEVTAPNGRPLLIANPVYVNWLDSNLCSGSK